MQKEKVRKKLNLTVIGSCLSNFVVSDYLPHALENIDVSRQSSALQLRTDIVVGLLESHAINTEVVKYYLTNGRWSSNIDHHEYAKWFSTFIVEKIDACQFIANDKPDVLVMDSLCDIRHSLYAHKTENYKAFLGNIQFEEESISNEFNRNFRHIGLLSADDQIQNIAAIFDFYKQKNHGLQLYYMIFPFHPDYIENKWIGRANDFDEKLEVFLMKNEAYAINIIRLPSDKIKPITDPNIPNYSPQVWNHFYPEVYEYFAKELADHLR